MRRALALAIIPISLLTLGACSAPQTHAATSEPTLTPTPATFDVIGTLDVEQTSVGSTADQPCVGTGEYSDIRQGVQTKISDATGKVIALGSLGVGLTKDTYSQIPGTDICQYTIAITGVPDGGDGLYGIEVAHRGTVNFTKTGRMGVATMKLG